MKKIVLLVALLSIIAVISIGCATPPKSTTIPQVPVKPYYAEQIAPNIIRITALDWNWVATTEAGNQAENWAAPWGFGNAFSEAIKDISKEHQIQDVIPITYKTGYGSVTAELHIILKSE